MELITGAHQQTVNLRYQRGKDGLYAAFIWRYDSGLVATGVPDLAAALTLTAGQQVIRIGRRTGYARAAHQAMQWARHIHLAYLATGRHGK